MDDATQGEARQAARAMVYGGEGERDRAISSYRAMPQDQRQLVALELGAAAAWRTFNRRRQVTR